MFRVSLNDDASELGDGLYQNDSRHHRVVWEMSFQKCLVAANSVNSRRFRSGNQREQLVQKAERGTMRKSFQGALNFGNHQGIRIIQPSPTVTSPLELENTIRPFLRIPISSVPVESSDPSALNLPAPEAMKLRWWLRAPWDYVMMALGLLYWGVFGGLLTLIAGPLHLLLPRETGQRLGRFFIHQLFSKFVVYLRFSDLVRADLTALDQLDGIKHAFIAAPNHTSLWDVVFIIARLPSAVCIMKKQILHNIVLGGGARLAGYISNDSISLMIRNASKSLGEGGQLLLFPEGTRTQSDARWINPLKGGCAIIAMHSQVPVYPIFIRSNTRFLQKGWPLWRRPVFPILMRIDLGKPLTIEPGESPQLFTARLSKVYEQELSKPDPLRRVIDPEFP
jgi:1-acyl-sn-glycerol-3-phosphate acyltransferase